MAIETIVIVTLGLYYVIGLATASYLIAHEMSESPQQKEEIEMTTVGRPGGEFP